MTENGKNLLQSYLVRFGHTHKDAAEVIGISEKTFTKKVNHYDGADFTLEEARALAKFYHINKSAVVEIFFAA